jgi:polyhydroxyalkanoate synthesis repressor PhaR
VRLIKKYANRKFYDTGSTVYVSLGDIAALVREGEEIQVVEYETGNDITCWVLSQILREQEKRDSSLPRGLLTALVRRGTDGLNHLRGSFQASLKALQVLEEEISQRVDSMAERGEITLTEAQELREELLARALERQQRVEESMQGEIEESLQRLGVPSLEDIQGIRGRLEKIEAKVDSLLSQAEVA